MTRASARWPCPTPFLDHIWAMLNPATGQLQGNGELLTGCRSPVR